ncbi:MAG TPA: DUF4249 domain-containing protein [Bacteroidales bacterium]|nr:DUF4249 domain-containing protein [Bacteroidales bacterium]
MNSNILNVLKLLLYISVFSTFHSSCTKEIEIDIPPSKPKLVVYSTFVPFTIPYPKNFEVKVYATAHIFDTVKYPIRDAIVQLYKNNEFYDTINFYPECDCYTIPEMFFAEIGDEYSLIVERGGFETVTASSYIPSKVYIRDTIINPISYINEFGSAVGEIQFSFTDPVNENNYYELALSSGGINYDDYDSYFEIFTNATLITSQSYYPDLIRFDVPYPKFLLFSDDNINGQSVTLTIYYNPPQWFGEINYISTHYRTLHLRNVTKEYFDFKTTSIQQDYAKREDFLYGMGEPINVISNIENGFGVFAGFNNDYVTFKIDSVVVNK